MADTKVSGMQPATSVNATDLLYLVNPNETPYDYKLSITNLFAGIPVPVKLNNTLTLGGTPQTLSSAGAIDITKLITQINSPDNSGTLSIPTGANGQIKVIVMASNSGGHTLSINSNIAHSSISFDAAGSTAILMSLGSVWYFIGGTATVS